MPEKKKFTILCLGNHLLGPRDVAYLESIYALEMNAVDRIEDGLNAMSRTTYDLIMLEVTSQDLAASDLLPSIKTQQPNAGIIVITSDSSREIEREARRHGIIYYMIKPTNRKELMDIITFQATKKTAGKGATP